ncbi:MAG: HlyD family secretion protein [Salinicola sp.]|uniref:efflux RND transporter periplasmic adaptor subunit n=1 Tax=Salinicola sp. TaxID=1978524 RepID=UPI001D9788F4|nr:HlyD family secretion protein [Salinicola sp.]NRB54939.1 HlyD family secretion protein [Salinicola sp.]
MKRLLMPVAKAILTLGAVIAAMLLVIALWQAYVLAPWTRDGRVNAQVVRIAPEVSGTIAEVAVTDDQYVKRGEVLYRIDPERFALAVEQAEARLASATATLSQKVDYAKRRKGLGEYVSREQVHSATQDVDIARAEKHQAQVALNLARLDLAHATLRSPVDGYVTHLRLRKGDYAVAGQQNLAVLDANSFWVTGYFAETKLQGIHPGAAATVQLMGFEAPLRGHVTSIGRGIANTNEGVDDQGLPSVEPSFSWVRLAQRIPVHIAIDRVPENIELAAGMTGSVEVDQTPGGNARLHGRLITLLHRWM